MCLNKQHKMTLIFLIHLSPFFVSSQSMVAVIWRSGSIFQGILRHADSSRVIGHDGRAADRLGKHSRPARLLLSKTFLRCDVSGGPGHSFRTAARFAADRGRVLCQDSLSLIPAPRPAGSVRPGITPGSHHIMAREPSSDDYPGPGQHVSFDPCTR